MCFFSDYAEDYEQPVSDDGFNEEDGRDEWSFSSSEEEEETTVVIPLQVAPHHSLVAVHV